MSPDPTPAALRGRRGAAALFTLLAAAYVLPLFFPPAAQAPHLPADGLSQMERLFPGVPGSWVVLRLLALALAAALLARRAPAPPAFDAGSANARVPRASARRSRLALIASLALFGVAFGSESFPAALQLGFVLALALPVAILGTGAAPRAEPRAAGAELRKARYAVLAVVGTWLLWRGYLSFDNLRAADAIDTWEGLESLEQGLAQGNNLLIGSRFPLIPDANLFTQGVSLVQLGLVPLSASLIQVFQLLWLALAGTLVGVVAMRRVAPAAGPVASAVLLFSPFCLMIPIQTLPYSLGPPLAAALMLAFSRAQNRDSDAALLALPLLLGLSTWHPAVIPLAALACAGGLLLLLARAPRRPQLLIAGLLLLGATLVPGFSNRFTLDGPFDSAYSEARVSWTAGERVLFGQASLAQTPILLEQGPAPAGDLVLGSLVAPFAIARTPMRLLGDALLDPIGALLTASGLALCLRHARRRRQAALLLAALVAALVTGFLSSYDRPSLTRISALPAVAALLAALGFDGLRAWIRLPAWRASAIATAAIALGGTLLFDSVNPRILPRSDLGIILAAVRAAPPRGGAVVLRPKPANEVGWRHFERIAAHLGDGRLEIDFASRLESLASGGSPELLFWNPRLEADAAISQRLCAARAEAALFRLRGPTGLSEVLAARPGGAGWEPKSSRASHWERRSCREAH